VIGYDSVLADPKEEDGTSCDYTAPPEPRTQKVVCKKLRSTITPVRNQFVNNDFGFFAEDARPVIIRAVLDREKKIIHLNCKRVPHRKS